MEDISDISSKPLRSLSISTRTLLSNLLNSTKVLPTEGPIQRHRDWRGLASLVNISSELEASINRYDDKTGKLLETWMEKQGGTVGELLEHLATLDRFDVYDDVIASIREQAQIRPDNIVALPEKGHRQIDTIDDDEIITFDDRPGNPHHYHAFLLYAEQDQEFVIEMKRILWAYGFEVCCKDNLLPGHASQYPPVVRLISKRCERIIFVCSPDFMQSHDNSYFLDYAQADSIESNKRKLLPILYRDCVLPPHLQIYHKLYYNCGMNNFWERLIKTMDLTRLPRCVREGSGSVPSAPPGHAASKAPGDINYRVNGLPAATLQANSHSNTHSAVNIETLPGSNAHTDDDSQYFLSPTPAPVRVGTPTFDTISLAPKGNLTPGNGTVSLAPSTVSLPLSLASLQLNTTAELIEPAKKKKPSRMKRVINVLTGKKSKKPLCA